MKETVLKLALPSNTSFKAFQEKLSENTAWTLAFFNLFYCCYRVFSCDALKLRINCAAYDSFQTIDF